MYHEPKCFRASVGRAIARYGYATEAAQQTVLVARIVQAREDGDAALERLLSAELLVSVRPVIRCAVFKCLPFAGSLSPEDLEQVAAMAVLRTVDKFDPSRGRQSFGDVAYFRARRSCPYKCVDGEEGRAGKREAPR
ncbi:hypothetical protein [Myxococcus sp. AB025B]|uniref:hypothetical protein n=1 Tax=Myxococcus sp. AB025B TaxID=2562794 RepID=UPI001143251B|nr:hypothetical protein [Myxococcus sp. AB025B]